jgi:hypothetical protein
MRLRIAAFALLLPLSFAGSARADGEGVAGHWKFTFIQDARPISFWMFDFESKDGKLFGSVEPTKPSVPGGKISNLVADGDLLRFSLKLENGLELRFEGKLPRAGSKKILGSIQGTGIPLCPAFLEATQAKNAFELKQELVTRSPSDPRVFATLLEFVPMATKEKLGARELQEMVDGVLANSEAYGPTFHSDFGVQLVEALEKGYPALAVEVGVKLEKSLDPKGESRLQLLTSLAASLKKLGRADDAAKLTAQIDAAEETQFKDYLTKEFDFPVPASTAKTTRPVLVELFTGAQCPPCVAADIACDALEKSFGDDAIILQYHLHIPGPDPLTAPGNEERAKMYGESFEGTPATFLNGKMSIASGGPKDRAEVSFRKCAEVVDKLLASPVTAKLTATAVRKGDEIVIKTEVRDVGAAKLRLHVMLTEDWIRYKGGNGVRYHRNVVRAALGKTDGFAVEKGDRELTIDVAKLRSDLTASLESFADKNDVTFPHGMPAIRLQDLHAVAFLQSEETGEILAATRVPVKTEK